MPEATATTIRLLTAALRRRDLFRLASIRPCSSSKFPLTPAPRFARLSMLAAAPSMEGHELAGAGPPKDGPQTRQERRYSVYQLSPEIPAWRSSAKCPVATRFLLGTPMPMRGSGRRRSTGKPISTSRAESTVNQLVSARMNKRGRCAGRPAAFTVCFRSGPQCWTDASATRHSSSHRSAPGF